MDTTEETYYQEISQQKIYTIKAIRVATFLGGPLVAGYLISENYRAFNEDKKSKMALVYGAVATILLFAAILMIPNPTKVPTYIIPVAYSWLTYLLVQKFLGEQMQAHYAEGGESYTIWRGVLVAVIGAVLTFGSLFVLILIFG